MKRNILLEILPWNICAKISEYPNISASANSLQQSPREEEASDWTWFEDKKEEAEAGAVEVEEEYGKIEGDHYDDQDKSDEHDDDQY